MSRRIAALFYRARLRDMLSLGRGGHLKSADAARRKVSCGRGANIQVGLLRRDGLSDNTVESTMRLPFISGFYRATVRRSTRGLIAAAGVVRTGCSPTPRLAAPVESTGLDRVRGLAPGRRLTGRPAVDRLGRSVREVAVALHELSTRGVHVRSLRRCGYQHTDRACRRQHHGFYRGAGAGTRQGAPGSSREARVARGLAATKPMKLDAAQQKRLLRLYQQGEPVSELIAMFGISRSTLFRTLRLLKAQEPSGTTR